MPSIKGLIRRAYNGFNKLRARALIPGMLVTAKSPLRLELLGEGEGAWTVPVDLIKPGWICYCVGVGVDATFDLALIERCGAEVYSLDPTPRAISYIEELAISDPRHHFVPIAVWSTNTTLKFYEPMNLSHVNLSTRDIHGTNAFVTVEAETLKTLKERLKTTEIDLLKIDIEGSWDEVINNMVEDNIAPKVLCVEFDTPTSPEKLKRAIRQLDTLGLKPIHQARDNVLFLREYLIN